MSSSETKETLNFSTDVAVDWGAVVALPFDDWEREKGSHGLDKWIRRVSNMIWSNDDEHFSQPQYTIALMRLLRLFGVKYHHDLQRLYEEKEEVERSAAAAHDAEEAIRARAELLRRENNELRELMEERGKAQDGKGEVILPLSPRFAASTEFDANRTREKLDRCTRELDRLRHENSELHRAIKCSNTEKSEMLIRDEKFRREYEHLVSRHKRLVEKSKKTDEMLREYKLLEKTKERDGENELHRLRQKVKSLQQENYDLIQARDRAEELCEERAAEALRDMTELQQLHRDIVDEEKQRVQSLTTELQRMKSDADNRLEEAVQGLQQKLKLLGEENFTLRKQLEGGFLSKRNPQDEVTEGSNIRGQSLLSDDSGLVSLQSKGFPYRKTKTSARTTEDFEAKLQRLQLENERLSAELQQMEIRAEAQDADNIKIKGLLKEYERGDEGLSCLRSQLTESNRLAEFLQDENAQLRERLNTMEDCLTFSAALQELCTRIGVTQEEIDRLRPRNSYMFSELEVLRGEVHMLKEEVEWLEKERRHWMDKVRLQPFLDTKLRLELGLSPEQLKRLDNMVDRMKSEKLIIDNGVGGGSSDDGENYKEKYFQELQLRRKETEYFKDIIRHRVEEALREAFGKSNLGFPPDATSALQVLQERIGLITARPLLDASEEQHVDVSQLRVQLQSALQLLEQSELTIKDNAASQANLREQLASVVAERDILMNERDKYRTAVFEALGITPSSLPAVGENELYAANVTGPTLAHNLTATSTGDTASLAILSAVQKDSPAPLRTVPSVFFSRTFEEQLRVKDELIASLKDAIQAARNDVERHRAAEANTAEKLAEACAMQEDLRNQVSAMQQIHEELSGKVEERNKTLEDLQEAMRHVDSGNTRELLQKIVVLRQREGKLLQRLRRVMEKQEEASRSEQTMREYVNTTFRSLKEALENTSTGFVLPPSSGAVCVEEDVIEEVRQRLDGTLRGKLLKEDTAYLLQLRQVYRSIDQVEELHALRIDLKNQRKRAEEMENEMGEQRVELECLRSLQKNTLGTYVDDASQAAKWETEAMTWRQKCGLYMKRLEDREREVSTLEAELEDARGELALLQEHLHKDDSYGGRSENFNRAMQARQNIQQVQTSTTATTQEQVQLQNKQQDLNGEAPVNKVRQLECDVARLKSINLGLLHHSLDLQGEYKRLEIQLEATKQELFLTRDSGESRKVSDFVSAAIQQHAALRRQSELALLRAKRARMQLCATEANLRVAVNEATAYRLSAFRLYRAYVTQMVSVLEYIRSLHRSIKGAMSPHRVEIMHQRFLAAIADVERTQAQQSDMAARLAESSGTIDLLQQQLELYKVTDGEERADALHAKLLESLSAVREKDARLAELGEDYRYMQGKLKRIEMHTQQMTEELARLELRAAGVGSFDEENLQKLLQLKETVFAKVESPAVVMHAGGTGSRHLDDADSDTAIREYKQALDKQSELARECASLKKRMEGEAAESRKARAEAETMGEEMNRMKERLQYTQRQLEEERRKSEAREQRVIRSHEAQAEVTRRAAEHNSQCLMDMLHNKEVCIQQLQDQLLAERRKHLEYQLEESARMERLHDHLFRENNAMMERFREAIDGVAENYTYNTTTQGEATASVTQPDGVAEQLVLLTKETLRLKSELKEARATNILLEAQLNEQISKAQSQVLQETHYNDQKCPQGAPPNEPSVVGIINDQNAIIESLRQREFNLTGEVQRYRKERDMMEQQLHEVRQLVVEQGGVLKRVVVAGASGSTVEQELRLQLTFVERQLSETQAQLEEERQNVLRLRSDTSQWQSHLDALREEIVKQQADVERARNLVTMNESLNADIRRVEEQNQKLIMATNMLKQRLIEQAQQRGDALHRQQHELALAQRMGSIQMESTEQLKAMAERLASIQRELENKVRREEEALKKHEEAQRMAYNLHKQLQEREEEILRLKHKLASNSEPSLVGLGRREKGTQVLQTVQEGIQFPIDTSVTGTHEPAEVKREKPQEEKRQQQHSSTSFLTTARGLTHNDADASVLSKPQIAATLRREIEKAQRDNTHEISSLRATVRRLESDLEETRQQLRGERDTSRSLRALVQNVRQEHEAKELAVARDSLARQQRPKKQQQAETQSVIGVKRLPVGGSVEVVSPTPLSTLSNAQDQLGRQHEENEVLKRQVERLKKRVVKFDDITSEVERYKKELAELREQQLESVDAAHMASPLDVRSHKRTVIHLEGVIESLQRELNVNKETQLRSLQRRNEELIAENQRLTAELNRRYQFLPGLQPPTTLLKNENIGERELLERELLEKNSTILDLRFEREALQLKVGRLERHIEDILRVDSTNMKRTETLKHRGRVEALESVVENMKLVVERLQHENDMLKTKTVSMSKHMDLVRELRELRVTERKLREHSEMLTKRLVDFAPSGSAMSKQQAKLYRKLQTAQATMEQYEAEMLELKQQLEGRQQMTGEDELAAFEEDRQEDARYLQDRRSVQPLDTWSSDLPPPLPRPPVTVLTGNPVSTGVCPRLEDDMGMWRHR